MQSALYIGRFQPFHNGHLSVIEEILKENDRVIIVIGSAEKNYLTNDPMTAGERYMLIEAALKEAKVPAEKYCIIPVRNVNNYGLWVNHINIHVPEYDRLYTGSRIVKACFEGKYDKQHRENKVGPEIIDIDRNIIPVSATQVRQAILNKEHWENLVPKAVAELLKKWEIIRRLELIQDTQDYTPYNESY